MSGFGYLSIALRDRLLAFRRRQDPPAWSPLSKPLAECTLALVCSNAYMSEPGHHVGPGEHECRCRTISVESLRDEPATQPVGELDLERMEDERIRPVLGCARMLVEAGRLGKLSRRHLSLSGSVIAGSCALPEAERAAVRQLTDDQVHVVLLVPT